MKKQPAFEKADSTENAKPLIISVCMHGKSDSWATKATIEGHITRAQLFEIIARGVAPQGKPNQTPEGLRGVELTLNEIRKAVLILIHSSNEYQFRRRFGSALTSALEIAGIFYVRTGIECQHLSKGTDSPRGRTVECCQIYRDILETALTHGPALELVSESAFMNAEKSDDKWHREHAPKTDKKHPRRKR